MDWQAVTGADNDSACRLAAEDGDFTALHDLLDGITTPSSRPRDDAWRAAETARLSFAHPPTTSTGTDSPAAAAEQPPPKPPRGRGGPQR